MAKVLGNIIIDHFMSDDSGDLPTTGHKIRYVVRDSVDSELTKSGVIDMNTINTSNTVATWWAAVQQQVKDEEGIT
jgi:hypothetical protein